MRADYNQKMWQPVRGKKQAYWGILAPDVLPNTVGKNMALIAQLQASYQNAKVLGDDKPNPESVDFSI